MSWPVNEIENRKSIHRSARYFCYAKFYFNIQQRKKVYMVDNQLNKFNHAQLIIQIFNSYINIKALARALAKNGLGEHPYWEELDDFGKRLEQMIEDL